MMIHYNRKTAVNDSCDRDSTGLDEGAVLNPVDPDLFFDTLPQPFRFLNKIIENLISSACDQVDQALKIQAKSMRLPKQQIAELSCLSQIDEDCLLAQSETPWTPIGDGMMAFFSNDSALVLWDCNEMVLLDSFNFS